MNDMFIDEEDQKEFEDNLTRGCAGCIAVFIGLIVLGLGGWGIYELLN